MNNQKLTPKRRLEFFKDLGKELEELFGEHGFILAVFDPLTDEIEGFLASHNQNYDGIFEIISRRITEKTKENPPIFPSKEGNA